jgi:hypothetical protein
MRPAPSGQGAARGGGGATDLFLLPVADEVPTLDSAASSGRSPVVEGPVDVPWV